MSLKHDYIWVLSTAIKRCAVPPGSDEKDKAAVATEEVHYRQGLAGAGPGTMRLVRKAFRALYMTTARLLRAVSGTSQALHTACVTTPSVSGSGGVHSARRMCNDLQSVLLDAWALDFRPNDQRFLMDSQLFPLLRRIMAGPEALDSEDAVSDTPAPAVPSAAASTAAPALPAPTASPSSASTAAAVAASPTLSAAEAKLDSSLTTAVEAVKKAAASVDAVQAQCHLISPRDITRRVALSASSGAGRIAALTDGKTDTYWQSTANENVPDYERAPKAHWLEVEMPRVRFRSDAPGAPTTWMAVSEVVWHLDGERDAVCDLLC
jgi:hypothetical protein